MAILSTSLPDEINFSATASCVTRANGCFELGRPPLPGITGFAHERRRDDVDDAK